MRLLLNYGDIDLSDDSLGTVATCRLIIPFASPRLPPRCASQVLDLRGSLSRLQNAIALDPGAVR